MIQNYLFVDGNYLRRAYEDSMRRFFTDVDARNLSLAKIRETVGASKGFYYDCVDEKLRDEGLKQKAWLDQVRGLPGFHVREGTISQGKRQKQVDVQLAVDMLTHAFHKNIWHATLIAGDLDFKPLVDALVNLGVHVHVYYEPRSAARPLCRAADVAVPLTIRTFWEWSSSSYQRVQPAPTEDGVNYGPGDHPPGIHTLDFQGLWNQRPVRLYGVTNRTSWVLHLPRHLDDESVTLRYPNRDALLKFFTLAYGGELTWPDDPGAPSS
jgi:uncharacterized LabA/DUF88 family protein